MPAPTTNLQTIERIKLEDLIPICLNPPCHNHHPYPDAPDSDAKDGGPVEEADGGIENVATAEEDTCQQRDVADRLGLVDPHTEQGGEDHLSGCVCGHHDSVLDHDDAGVHLDEVGVDAREDDAAAEGHDQEGEVDDEEGLDPQLLLLGRLQRVLQGLHQVP